MTGVARVAVWLKGGAADHMCGHPSRGLSAACKSQGVGSRVCVGGVCVLRVGLWVDECD